MKLQTKSTIKFTGLHAHAANNTMYKKVILYKKEINLCTQKMLCVFLT
jgi:hypothetical protein